MIEEYIEELNEKQRQRSQRLAEERYEALRNTITHLYGQAFLDELETNVSGIIRRSLLGNTIPSRLGLLRRQYRTKCKIIIPYNPIGKAAYRGIYETLKKQVLEQRERNDLKLMRRRSKVRQRYNRLAELIRRDFGEAVQEDMLWKAKALALAEVIQKQKYLKFSYAKGYAENDLSFALRHLRILYAHAKWMRGDGYETRIHNQINSNYKNGMLDYNKNK